MSKKNKRQPNNMYSAQPQDTAASNPSPQQNKNAWTSSNPTQQRNPKAAQQQPHKVSPSPAQRPLPPTKNHHG